MKKNKNLHIILNHVNDDDSLIKDHFIGKPDQRVAHELTGKTTCTDRSIVRFEDCWACVWCWQVC